jgi:large subunit ribosomal protein L29
MALPKIVQIKNLDLEKIQTEIIELQKQLFELRIKKGTRQTFKPHLFKHIKHRLKQLIFLEDEKIFNRTTS